MKRCSLFLSLLLVLAVPQLGLSKAKKEKKRPLESKAPTLATRRTGIHTSWVASEVILGPNIDLSISIDKSLAPVAYKLQFAEGDESFGDPVLGPWTDCTGPAAPGFAGSITCGATVPVFFAQFYDRDSRDGLYHVYQIQARHGAAKRYRARYAMEVQATGP